MAARTLVEALEGAQFPCDRAQLLEYARRNNVDDHTLAVLEEIPERRYRDLAELSTALSSPQPFPLPQTESELAAGLLPPLPAPLEWWMNGWRQMMIPLDLAAHCLRGSAETWPQWLRLGRRLWFPWAK